MVVVSQEHGVRFCVRHDILRCRHVVRAEQPVSVIRQTGHDLAPKREYRGAAADDHDQREECRAERLRFQPFDEQHYEVCNQEAGEQISNIEELVIVIRIGLEQYDFAEDEYQRRSGEYGALLARAEHQCEWGHCEHEADVFQPEPEPVLLPLIHPVQPNAQKMRVALDGAQRPQHELRRGEQHRGQSEA